MSVLPNQNQFPYTDPQSNKTFSTLKELLHDGTTDQHVDAANAKVMDPTKCIPPHPEQYLPYRSPGDFESMIEDVGKFRDFIKPLPLDAITRKVVEQKLYFIEEFVVKAFLAAPHYPANPNHWVVTCKRQMSYVMRAILQDKTDLPWTCYTESVSLAFMLYAVPSNINAGLDCDVIFCRIAWHLGLPIHLRYCWVPRKAQGARGIPKYFAYNPLTTK